MVKIYGTTLCVDCLECMETFDKEGIEYTLYDFKDDIENLKVFIHLRDTDPAFDRVKEKDALGIPCIVKEDGSIVIGLKRFMRERQ